MPKVNRVGKSRAKAAATTMSSQRHVSTSSAAAPTPPSFQTLHKDSQLKTSTTTVTDSSQQNLSKGQRKRLLKREQYLKREKMILSTLKLQKLEEQKGRLDGLDAIKEALEDTIQKNREQGQTSDENANVTHVSLLERNDVAKTNKARMNLAQEELTHLNLVLQHPSFVENPFATMQEHLKNSLLEKAEKLKQAAEEERVHEAKRAEEKKEARKDRIRAAKYAKGRRFGNKRK